MMNRGNVRPLFDNYDGHVHVRGTVLERRVLLRNYFHRCVRTGEKGMPHKPGNVADKPTG